MCCVHPPQNATLRSQDGCRSAARSAAIVATGLLDSGGRFSRLCRVWGFESNRSSDSASAPGEQLSDERTFSLWKRQSQEPNTFECTDFTTAGLQRSFSVSWDESQMRASGKNNSTSENLPGVRGCRSESRGAWEQLMIWPRTLFTS